ERQWVALGVLTHHRPLTGASGRGLFGQYDQAGDADFTTEFGRIDEEAARELMSWLVVTTARDGLPPAGDSAVAAARLGAAARRLLGELRGTWQAPVGREQGRAAALLQGAVTLADHLSSADATASLHARQPMDAAYATTLAQRYDLRDYQKRAADVDGHLLL